MFQFNHQFVRARKENLLQQRLRSLAQPVGEWHAFFHRAARIDDDRLRKAEDVQCALAQKVGRTEKSEHQVLADEVLVEPAPHGVNPEIVGHLAANKPAQVRSHRQQVALDRRRDQQGNIGTERRHAAEMFDDRSRNRNGTAHMQVRAVDQEAGPDGLVRLVH